jgi:phosphohistidine swiveling domain-containing protein
MSDIDKLKKIKDYFVFGEWYHVYWFHSSFVDGLTLRIKKELGIGLSRAVFEQDGHIFRIYMSKSEWDFLGKTYLKEIINDPEQLNKILIGIREAADKLIKLSNSICKRKVGSLSSKDIADILENYDIVHHELWSLGMIPNVLEMQQSILSDYLKDYLQDKSLTAIELLDAFQTLSIPREDSITQREGADLLELAKLNNRRGLKTHYKKYKWLTFGWIGPNTDYGFFEDQFNALTADKKSLKAAESALLKHKKFINNKQKYIRQLSITPEYQNLFRLLEEILFLKAYRVDALYISYSTIWPILKKIARDNDLSLKQVYSLHIPRLVEYLRSGKFDVNKINDILKYSVEYYNGTKLKFHTGPRARNIVFTVKSSLVLDQKTGNELIGECAWPGKVKGIVKVINQASEMDKLKTGEILVSNITDPSLLPAMKKARAFITNSGGLTCHAAITARELKTPCVVGTKVATKVLKDGDLVEVDASKGVVKILNK